MLCEHITHFRSLLSATQLHLSMRICSRACVRYCLPYFPPSISGGCPVTLFIAHYHAQAVHFTMIMNIEYLQNVCMMSHVQPGSLYRITLAVIAVR